MGKGFGVAALVVALLAFAVPLVTIYVVWLALGLAVAAALFGDKVFPIAAVCASLINLVFFSPLTWMALAGESLGGGSALKTVTILLFIAPIAALIFRAVTKPTSAGA